MVGHVHPSRIAARKIHQMPHHEQQFVREVMDKWSLKFCVGLARSVCTADTLLQSATLPHRDSAGFGTAWTLFSPETTWRRPGFPVRKVPKPPVTDCGGTAPNDCCRLEVVSI